MTKAPKGDRGPLTAALKELHSQAGFPALRQIATMAGDISHQSVADALSGKNSLPSWRMVARIITALGGFAPEYRALWVKASERGEISADTTIRAPYWLVTLKFRGTVTAPNSLEAIVAFRRRLGIVDGANFSPTKLTARNLDEVAPPEYGREE